MSDSATAWGGLAMMVVSAVLLGFFLWYDFKKELWIPLSPVRYGVVLTFYMGALWFQPLAEKVMPPTDFGYAAFTICAGASFAGLSALIAERMYKQWSLRRT